MNVEETLSSLGLSKNEIKTYLALITYGKLSALENAKKTGIHRSNSYDALHSLMEKGFISQIIDGSRMVFIAREPEVLKDYIKQQEKEIDNIVEELNEISHVIHSEQGVKLSTGMFSVRETLRDIFNSSAEVELYGITNKIMQRIGEGYLNEIYKQRIKNKASLKSICNFEDPYCNSVLKIQEYSEVKFLNEKYHGEVITILYDKKVVLLVFSEVPIVISISNSKVHDSYKHYFEILWKKAKS